MYPLQVEINEASIERLTTVFKVAYKDIVGEIEGATNFGVSNRKAILGQIRGILTDLGSNVDDLVSEELPDYYKSGADDAVKQLENADARVRVAKGFNRVHKEAIAALVDDTARAFGESMSGVNRSAQQLLGKAVRDQLTQEIAKGKIAGEALKTTKNSIKQILKDQGLDALKDKGGRSWTLDRYAEMLLRTKAVEARNRGLANRMVENGYDLVQVSNHNSDHPECAEWEGKVLSLTGATTGYPTLAEAEAAGLFHPNCKHAINVLVPELAKETEAYNFKTAQYE